MKDKDGNVIAALALDEAATTNAVTIDNGSIVAPGSTAGAAGTESTEPETTTPDDTSVGETAPEEHDTEEEATEEVHTILLPFVSR